MWRAVSRRRSSTLPMQVPATTPREAERVERVLEKISEETFLVFDLLKDGMVKEASFKTVEESIAKRSILSTFGQVRADAFGDAASIAREQSRRFASAADDLTEPQQRQFALAVARAFEHFAGQLQSVERSIHEAERKRLSS